jgi:hypothetical protein
VRCQFWGCANAWGYFIVEIPESLSFLLSGSRVAACGECAAGFANTHRVTRRSDGTRVWRNAEDALVAWCEEHDDCRACGELGAACAALPRTTSEERKAS